MPSGSAVDLLTIGHSNHALETFLELLAVPEAHIAQIVDVRSAPYSRFAPAFNREALGTSLDAHGIGYAFAGQFLGGRPTDPACYKTGVLPEGKANYLELVDYDEVARQPWFRRGLERLIEIAAGERTAIMCSEEDPLRCHRHHLIAKALVAEGVAVRHLRRDGSIVEAVFEDGPAPAVHAGPVQPALF